MGNVSVLRGGSARGLAKKSSWTAEIERKTRRRFACISIYIFRTEGRCEG